jgi:pimeloyl-ACP methyl ester carboxylesterase
MVDIVPAMSLPGLVLIHGGAHAADCWDLTVAELARHAPELRVLAVDLPGRGNRPAELSTVTVADWVDSVVADVEQAGMKDVVVAGHSMAGLVVPGVIEKLGHPRAREAIFVAAFVPPQGSTILEFLGGPLVVLARAGARLGKEFPMPGAAARLAFWNGMTVAEQRFARARLYSESVGVLTEKADRSAMPDDVPRTWILTLRDRSLSSRRQRRYIEELGGVDSVICVDTCHDVMYSEPERLARILIERCTFRAQV